MGKQKSIKLNYVMNCILTVSSMIFPLISYPYVSRILKPEGMGRVAFANSIVAYFTMAAMMGIPTYGIRACARVRDDKEKLSETVWELLVLNLIMTLFTYVVFGISILLVPKLSRDRALFAVMGINIIFQMLGAEWLFKAVEEYAYITVRSLAFKIVTLILMFLCIQDQDDYIIYGGLTMLAGAGSNICNLIRMRQFVKPFRNSLGAVADGINGLVFRLRKFVKGACEKHLKFIAVFFAMTAATTIYTNLDVAMLGFMSGDTEAGYYSVAVKIKGVLVGFVTALGGVLLPRMSYYAEQKMSKQFWETVKKAFLFVGIVSVPLCIFFVFFAKYSILILSGEAFLPAVLPMQIIMPTLILIGFSNICGIQILVPLGMEKEVLYSEIIGSVIDVCLNLWLIPFMGAAGAAIGTLAAEAAVLVYQIYAVYRMKSRL